MEKKTEAEERRKRKGKRKKIGLRRPASFTVEAALLMSVLLPVVLALIYASFFLHDRCVLQGAACELAAMASNLSLEENRGQLLEERKGKLLESSRLLNSKAAAGRISCGTDSVTVTCTASFLIPGWLGFLFGWRTVSLRESCERALLHPADTIRRLRGAKDLLDAAAE